MEDFPIVAVGAAKVRYPGALLGANGDNENQAHQQTNRYSFSNLLEFAKPKNYPPSHSRMEEVMRYAPLLRVSLLLFLVCPLFSRIYRLSIVSAQGPELSKAEESDEDKKDRITAERFLELLKKKPRLGTALDKVYGYHVSRGSLDALTTSIEAKAEEEKNGNLWLVVGMFAMQRGQDSQAASVLEKAESLSPADPLVSYYLGKSLILLGQVDAAAAALQRAIDKKPARTDLLEISQDLGRIYQRTNRNEEALAVWKRLEATFPGDQQVQEEIASILAEEGAREAALERYDVLAKNHKDKFRQIEMAIRANQLRAEMGQRDLALTNFESILQKVNPDSWLYRDVRRRIDEVFLTSNDYDGLIQYYRKWIESHPDDIEAMMRIGRQLSIQRRAAEAQSLFRQAIERAPSNSEARQLLVDVLVSENKVTDATKEMSLLVDLEPDNVDRLVRWGSLIMSDEAIEIMERRKQASQVWQRLLTKRGGDPVTVSRVADLVRGAELPDEAISLYRKAIALADNEPQYREYLGEYLNKLARKDEALVIWEEIALGSRESRENCVRLSEIMKQFDYPTKAIAAIARACELNPAFEHRARYSELLRDDKQFDESLAQLDLAEKLAEDKESREKLVDLRVKAYQAAGKLQDRIVLQEKLVETEQSNNAAAWQLLAMLREANGKFQEATIAIQKAIELDSNNINYSLAAARLQERSGQIGPAIETYRRLASIDRRFMSNYLTQIAGLQMRLGQGEAALKTGRELIASAPNNADNYRFFADLCFQAGDNAAGLDALRRNLRNHPNDLDAINALAKYLSNELKTDEAIELYWRAFGLAKDSDAKAAPITSLTELYLRANRFETLIKRLETIGREENKVRDATLWTAAAYQSAGDLGMAKSILERLIRQESRDTKLFEQIVALSKAEYDLESAAEYQRRLNIISPSPQGEYALAGLLADLGQIDEAESVWIKLSSRDGKATSVTAAINSLIAKDQFESAFKIVEKALAQSPDQWELFAPGMISLYRAGKKAEAREMATKVLGLTIAPSTLSESAKQQLVKSAKAPNASQLASSYSKENVVSRQRMSQQINQLKQSVFPDRDRYYGSNGPPAFSPTCFADVRLLAKGILQQTMESESAIDNEIKEKVALAKTSKKPKDLWDAMDLMLWKNSDREYAARGEASDEYEECLALLISLGDRVAKLSRINRLMNTNPASRRNDEKPVPLSAEQLVEAETLINEVADGAQVADSRLLWLAGQWKLTGQKEKADALIEKLSVSNQPAQLMQMATQLLSEEEPQSTRAIVLFRKALDESLKQPKGQVIQVYNYSQLVGAFAEKATAEQWVEMLDLGIQYQVSLTTKKRPSERVALATQTSQAYYFRNGNYVRVEVPFPQANGYLEASLLASLKIAYDQKDANTELQEATRETLRTQLQTWASATTDDATLRIVRQLAWATFAIWDNKKDIALSILSEMQSLDPSNELFNLLSIRLLSETGQTAKALAMVERIKPVNQQMLVDRELTILQLVIALGDLDRARQSAQRLFVLRLKPEIEFKLCDLMYQLGLKEQADRMMERIQRRSGGKQDTLMLLMNRYVSTGDKKKAAEIARSILRRTKPRGGSQYMTQEFSQNESALKVLSQAGELKSLIEQTEDQFKRSPKSLKIIDSLASYYDAAGRRDDATKLRSSLAGKSGLDPTAIFQVGIGLSRANKHAEAVDQFLDAIRKKPEMLSDRYYDMQTSLTSAKAWGKLVALIEEIGPIKFRNSSYRIQEVAQQLVQTADVASAETLFKVIVAKGDLEQLGYVADLIKIPKFKFDESTQEAVLKRVIDLKFASGQNTFNYVRSYQQNGKIDNPIFKMLNAIADSDKLYSEICTAMEKRLSEKPEEILPRAMLASVQAGKKKWEELESIIQPWKNQLESSKANDDLPSAIWSIASQIPDSQISKMTGLVTLLESAAKSKSEQLRSNGFQYSPGSLLVHWYIKLDRAEDAKKQLLQAYKESKLDDRYTGSNQAYAESQLFQTRTQIATLLATSGSPIEAYIIFRRLKSDTGLKDRVQSWAGNSDYYLGQLETAINAKMTPEATLSLVSQSLGLVTTVSTIAPTTPKQEDNKSKTKPNAAELKLDRDQIESMLALELTHTNPLDFKIEFPFASLVDKISKNRKARTQFEALLKDFEASQLTTPKEWTWAFLVAKSFGNPSKASDCVEQVSKWLQNVKEFKADGVSMPDELALTAMAKQLESEGSNNDLAIRLLQRAESIAVQINQPDLARSLRCELAVRISKTDPALCKSILSSTLDELFPKKGKE